MGRGKRRKVTIGTGGHNVPEYKLIEGAFGHLREQKIVKVQIEFYAGGEEYHLENISLEPEIPEEGAQELENRLDEAFAAVLNVGAGGWDAEDGSYGTLTMDVSGGVVDVNLTWNEETTTDYTESYSLTDIEELRQSAKENKRDWLSEPLGQIEALFAELESRNVASVTATYNGGGDDGAIEEIDFEPVAGADIPDGVDPLSGVDVDHLAFTLVNLEHSGWENNSGGRGEVVFDVEAKEARVSHSDFSMGTREDPFWLEGFIPFEIVKLKRGPRARVSALAD